MTFRDLIAGIGSRLISLATSETCYVDVSEVELHPITLPVIVGAHPSGVYTIDRRAAWTLTLDGDRVGDLVTDEDTAIRLGVLLGVHGFIDVPNDARSIT